MSKQALLAGLEAAARKVDAIETLAASLAAGMHAGVVDADHVHTLLGAIAASIRTELSAVVRAMEVASGQAPGC